jgi:hypothetical protein
MQKLKHTKPKQRRHLLTVNDLLYPLRCSNKLFRIVIMQYELQTNHEVILDLEARLFHPFIGEGGFEHIKYL